MPDGGGDAFIRALPPHLQRVPGFAHRGDDAWRSDWIDTWRPGMLAHRAAVRAVAESDPDFRADERLLCAADPKYWMAVWGQVYEPRVRRAQGKHVPYTPFAFQCHVIDWLVALADNPEQLDGYITKARGIGISWTIVAFAVWGWAYHDITTLLLSRTQAEVDKPNNINTLFGKALYLIDALPPWLLPEGFNRERDRTQMNIANPESKAQIFGDSTTAEAGRSDRATIAFVDEAAFIRELRDVWTTLDGTTDHTVSVSTKATKYGMTWRNTWQNAQIADCESVFVLDYPVNPYQDEAWLARERKRREDKLDLPGFYQEVLRDPFTGRSSIIYPEAHEIRVFAGSGYDPALPVIIGYDPGTVDDTAIIFGQPLDGDPRSGVIHWFDSYERNAMPAEFYAHILTGIAPEPEDPCYGLPFSSRDLEIMALTAQFPWNERVKVVMDPAGRQTDSGLPGQNSTQLRIYQQSKKLRERWVQQQVAAGTPYAQLPKPKPIYPLCEKIIALNNHQARHNAARDLLKRSTWADTPGARRIVSALQSYRLGTLTPSATREPIPIHDDDCSHLATAFEFVAVYRGAGPYLGFKLPKPAPERPAAWSTPALAGVA